MSVEEDFIKDLFFATETRFGRVFVQEPVQIITPVNSTHRFVVQAIEKGTLQNLIFDNQAFANHRAMAAVFKVILDLPPLKQALASKQFKSVYLDRLLSAKKKEK